MRIDDPRRALAALVRTHKALGHPGRLRLLAMLRGGPLCVCQMTAVLDLAPSTVSAHLAELRGAGLVAERKDGKWVEYRVVDGPASALLDWNALATDPVAARDRAVLARLRKVPLEELCRAQLDLDRLGIRLPARSRELR